MTVIDTQKKRPSRRNLRKLLARLNPRGQTFQGGGFGSIPIETALDIAAACGMAGQSGDPQKLAVLALCLRWWPGMFEGPQTVIGHVKLHHHPKKHLFEYDDGKGPIDPKRLLFLHGCCELRPVERPSETDAFKRITGLIERCIYNRIRRDQFIHEDNLHAQIKAQLHGERLPELGRTYGRVLPDALVDDRLLVPQLDERGQVHYPMLERWSRVVIDEYRNPNHCQACQQYGRVGEVPKAIYEDAKLVRFDWMACPICFGQGVMAWSAHRRAQALGIGIHPFRDYLAVHHDGALALIRTLEDRGAELVLKRLGDGR